MSNMPFMMDSADFFLLHSHENQSKLVWQNGWVEILTFSLVSRKFLAMRNITLQSLDTYYVIILFLTTYTPRLYDCSYCRPKLLIEYCKNLFTKQYRLMQTISNTIKIVFLSTASIKGSAEFCWYTMKHGLLKSYLNFPTFRN